VNLGGIFWKGGESGGGRIWRRKGNLDSGGRLISKFTTQNSNKTSLQSFAHICILWGESESGEGVNLGRG